MKHECVKSTCLVASRAFLNVLWGPVLGRRTFPRTGPSRDPSRTMANRPSRPLPTPPVPVYPLSGADHNDIYSSFANPYHSSNPHPPFGLPSPTPRTDDGPPPGTLRGGTLLHKGFYDLLALIPTPSPSRFLWGANADPSPEAVAGPRYEDLPGHNNSLRASVMLLRQLPTCRLLALFTKEGKAN
ncbi:hypothetical protein V8E53_010143 [Lactarius tabidus]